MCQIRKICAANFGEFTSIVGQETTEELLVSTFSELKVVIGVIMQPLGLLCNLFGKKKKNLIESKIAFPVSFEAFYLLQLL